MSISRILSLAAIGIATAFAAAIANAQGYPARPVKILVATAAGGSTDIAARIIGQALQEKLGQSFVIENRPGGANNTGTEAALRSAPDGYTLFCANSVNTINATFYEKLPFDFLADITPVGGVMRSVLAVQVHPSVSAKTLPELIALAKASPGKLVMGSGGLGATGHVAGELFQLMSGTKMTHVPYRGEAPALTDQLGGHVQVTFTTLTSSIEYLRAGTLRPLGVSSAARLPAFPDVPTIGEAVLGYEASSWSGIVAPKGTPGAIVDVLNRQINAALAGEAARKRFAEIGAGTFPGSAAEFGTFLAADVEKWAKVIKFSGMKPN